MSSSRNSAIAGAVAGLLVAAFGAWYVSAHRSEAAPAPAPAPVHAAPVSLNQAAEKLMALPELKRWADNIEKASGGAREHD